ncbi:MAG: PolC-type DNA polymerase III [Succiniclasticum sp.]|nr:PolC-type DNA polymerase III [Succiniclasticum sp.]
MKPDFYIDIDDSEFGKFVNSLSLSSEQKLKSKVLRVHKLWAASLQNAWQIDYNAPCDPGEDLLGLIADALQQQLGMTEIRWNRLDVKTRTGNTAPRAAKHDVPAAPPAEEIPLPPEACMPSPDSAGGEETLLNGMPAEAPAASAAAAPAAPAAVPQAPAPAKTKKDPMEDEAYRHAYEALYGDKHSDGYLLGRHIRGSVRPMNTLKEAEKSVVVEGCLVGALNKDGTKFEAYTEKELRNNKFLLLFSLADDQDGVYVKVMFDSAEECRDVEKHLKKGVRCQVQGKAEPDRFNHDAMTILASAIRILPDEKAVREDKAPVKRVELHCHTKMSKLDAITDITALLETAIRFGHKAIAITDHGVVQAFPFCTKALEEIKGDIKLLLGCEGYLITPEEGDILKEGLPHAGKIRSHHIILIAKNKIGLRNLYKLISLSHLNYLNGNGSRTRPMIPRDVLSEFREGILIGSACEAGEVYRAVEKLFKKEMTEDEVLEIAKFYDYLEIQPLGNNAFLTRQKVFTQEELMAMNKKVYELAQKLGKLCCATCDVHFLNPEDARTREILQHSQGYKDAEFQAPLYYRTTEEMLREFSYFDPETAEEICITNPNKIADQCESMKPVPDTDQLYSPALPGAEQEIHDLSYEKAHRLYGDPLPKIVEDRLHMELDAIINHGYAVLYDIAHKLVKHSMDDGYIVGSRGSVGSSFVACMTDITEVNPLVPHYRCPKCRHTEFFTNNEYASGFDMPVKMCPECGTEMVRDGHNIPFAVFMGLHGDKVPDIDLNFSDEYQHSAHKYTEELFGRDNVCRAGTITTVAPKTAWSYARKYFEDKNFPVHPAFISKFAEGLNGVKRGTGQHPAGIMVIPRDMDIHYFTGMNHPADDKTSDIITTHFDYHSINDRLVKLDILGHVDPTMIKRLQEFTGIDPTKIPINDPETMALFSGTEVLGVTPEQIGTNVGTLGIPECGTTFTLGMISDLKPKLFSDIVRISGYSHGTGVWLGNAKDLIQRDHRPVEQTISTRDDVMTSLIARGVDPTLAFKTMEYVRKGKAAKKGLEPQMREAMEKAGVPEWYMKSCETVQYLFPKAHAVAYVLNAYRIAYCKVHYPTAYYAAYFTQRADVDANFIYKGEEYIRQYIKNVDAQGFQASPVAKTNVIYLQLILEMLARGFRFFNIDLYKSHGHRFIPTEEDGVKGVRIPLSALPGVGDGVGCTLALTAKEAREKDQPFLSMEDLLSRCSKVESAVHEKALQGLPLTDEERNLGHVGQTALDALNALGALGDLPETNQMSLF